MEYFLSNPWNTSLESNNPLRKNSKGLYENPYESKRPQDARQNHNNNAMEIHNS
jgi:hypothetical protein